MSKGIKRVWTPETEDLVSSLWATKDEIDICFAVNELAVRLASGAAVFQTSPRGVLYRAHYLNLLTDYELDHRLTSTKSNSWKTDYRKRRAETGL